MFNYINQFYCRHRQYVYTSHTYMHIQTGRRGKGKFITALLHDYIRRYHYFMGLPSGKTLNNTLWLRRHQRYYYYTFYRYIALGMLTVVSIELNILTRRW